MNAVIEKAIEIMERRGWGSGELLDYQTGAVCTVGALRAAGLELRGEVEYDSDYLHEAIYSPGYCEAVAAVAQTLVTDPPPDCFVPEPQSLEEAVSDLTQNENVIIGFNDSLMASKGDIENEEQAAAVVIEVLKKAGA